ncbi:uncharacterized protein BDZ99DRAFT_50741 [Mytilinidion resinicola]|uniref:Protein NO VEIN C-terminal domain-containing protein n=1 Tax=Mytilinidion resinicola TaxID=574789 RepID=A0A6A6YI84_9PEZI|nr:uncharacterized protein BDZ99DRAFT_50741 [Mytilinidion resinicola]KAF2808268.1 hypothetical protein BDZ99DRAFT_50741 [Mytilinidion resinicola]
MSSDSREEARVFIDKLRENNGGIAKADREFLAQTKPHILTTFDNIRRKLGASTRALADNLYAKDTRFVYELIQNAEDNKYSIANSSSELPWLTFRLYQDRIVIDSNEDGFSKANIMAICSIGESTKSSAQGYIGEKGIGFKSVFKVAHKVHVQSGPYSFAFEHQRDGNDNGLGMVTPMNEDYLDVPDGVRTRITLHLLASCDTAALRKEFLGLPDTLLLFLKKLKRLSIHITSGGFSETERTYSLSSSENRVSLHTSHKAPFSGLVSSTKDYWISRRHVTNMPSDRDRKNINEAEVILAFPLDGNDHPVIETQHAFAFLPMRKVGYKFLIQSDFITQASREDVFDTPWNNRLLEEVAETFLQSIDGFLLHPTLRHHWIRYIPTDSVPDDLWNRIQIKLHKAISSRSLFFSRDNGRLWRANELRILIPSNKDEDGEPLFPDLAYPGPTAYISDTYDRGIDIPILKSVGLSLLSMQDLLDRLAQDLNRLSPRMHSMSPSNQWHSRVADLLISFMQHSNHTEFLKKLPIVPLNNGKWVRPRNASIFFPTSGGIDIPDGLPNLNLVDTGALRSQSRRTLFSKLGVIECEPSRIFPLIEERHRSGGTTPAQSVSYIRFIYWHHTKLPSKNLAISLAPSFVLNKQWFNPFYSRNGWTYCPRSEDLHAMSRYIGFLMPDQLKDQIRFTYPAYYDELQKCERRNDKAGVDWFREYFQIKHTPQLCRRDNMQQISSEVEYIAKHQSQSLLGVLQANWHQYCSEWDAYFKSTELPILHSDKLQRLDTTYLPLPKLKSIVSRLGLEEGFGFLKELEDIAEHTASKWAFLDRFGVVMEENVSFWLELLKKAQTNPETKIEVVFEIYANLQKYVDPESRKIKNVFEGNLVLIPPVDSESHGSWNSLDSCVWDGPEWFTFKHRLGAITQYQDLYSLFRNTLRVSNAGCDDFLAYLQDIKDSETNITSSVEAKIRHLYEQLNEETKAAWILSPKEKIKSMFDENKLIYNPGSQSWCGPSSCIWAEDTIQLPGKFSLATTYKKQKSFFLSILDVTKPNLEMHILALMQKAVVPDKRSIMQEMLNICAFDVTPQAVEKLSDCKCLPVKLPSGEIQWLHRSGTFAIVDRRDYGQIFTGRIKVLDFSLEEVHSLRPLLFTLGLGGQYLSKAVREETTVEGGSIDEHLTEDLRRKSYAICRYAAHLGSKKVKNNALAVHRTLQNMDVYVSDGISKSVSVRQNGRSVTIPQESAYFHLDQQDDKLKLYIPQSKKHQQVCLSRQLPITLLKHFGVTSALSGQALGSIMTALNLFVVDEILEEDGIIEIEGIERPEDDRELEASDSETTRIPASTSQMRASPFRSTDPETSNIPVITSQAGSPGQSARVLTPSTPPPRTGISPDLFLSPGISTPGTSTFDGLPSSPERPHLYRELLDAVIRQAEGLSNLPMKGRTIEAPMAANWGFDTLSAVSSHIPGEKEFKIGAAGELFVYELLKGLTLPGFTLANWQSTISYRVAVHERYRDLERWLGSETADIVYEDQNSFLTELLIERGYLENAIWGGHSPRYYIEVKTTIGSLETPFYCSQLQYDRMERMQLNGAANEVYLIVRVFSLGDSGMGLKVYMDPATLRRDRGLIFKTDKYSVTPGYGR